MKRKWAGVVGLLIILLLGTICVRAGEMTTSGKPTSPAETLIVSGTITNLQGKAVKEVGLHFFLNGQKLEQEEEVTTSKAGRYEAELKVPKGSLPAGKVELEASKPSYQTSGRTALDKVVAERIDEKGNAVFLAHQSLQLKRAISPAFWIATLVLLLVYVLIAFEVMHRTLAAMLGAALLHVYHLYGRDIQRRL